MFQSGICGFRLMRCQHTVCSMHFRFVPGQFREDSKKFQLEHVPSDFAASLFNVHRPQLANSLIASSDGIHSLNQDQQREEFFDQFFHADSGWANYCGAAKHSSYSISYLRATCGSENSDSIRLLAASPSSLRLFGP
jgi:hypothetical protein